MVLEPGQIIHGQYRVLRELGIGGMGVVYLAEDLDNHVDVALKVLKPDLARHDLIRQRFLREASLQRNVHHPHIARVYSLIEVDGSPAIVMEYLRGWNLADWIDAGNRMTHVQVSTLGKQVASALEAAHQAGAVHRDLKPDNIFLIPCDDGSYQAKVIDFGVAKVLDAAPLTVTDAFVGTYRYASPEQIIEATKVDYRSDLYSFGVLLWELLSHRQPWHDLYGTYAVQNAVLNDLMPSVPDDVPSELAVIVRKLLIKEPDLRFQTAGGVLSALEGAYDEAEDLRIGARRNRPSVDTSVSSELEPIALDKPKSQKIHVDIELLPEDEKSEDYATLERQPQESGDFRFVTDSYEIVASNKRAHMLWGLLVLVIGGVALYFAIRTQFHPIVIPVDDADAGTEDASEGSGNTDLNEGSGLPEE